MKDQYDGACIIIIITLAVLTIGIAVVGMISNYLSFGRIF